jgi:hypothetical protein
MIRVATVTLSLYQLESLCPNCEASCCCAVVASIFIITILIITPWNYVGRELNHRGMFIGLYVGHGCVHLSLQCQNLRTCHCQEHFQLMNIEILHALRVHGNIFLNRSTQVNG